METADSTPPTPGPCRHLFSLSFPTAEAESRAKSRRRRRRQISPPLRIPTPEPPPSSESGDWRRFSLPFPNSLCALSLAGALAPTVRRRPSCSSSEPRSRGKACTLGADARLSTPNWIQSHPPHLCLANTASHLPRPNLSPCRSPSRMGTL